MPAIPARVLRHESLGVRAYVLLNVVLPSQQSLDRGATPALVSVGRCQSVFYGAFAGGLEDDPSGNFDGVVGDPTWLKLVRIKLVRTSAGIMTRALPEVVG